MHVTATDPEVYVFPADHPTLAMLDIHEAEYAVGQNLQTQSRLLADRLPARYADAAATEPAVQEWVVRTCLAAAATAAGPWLRSGPSLLLLGPTGVGKTHQAWGAVRALALTGAHYRWALVSAAELYARLRPRPDVDSEMEFEHFATADVLVVDDLGAAKPSEWTEEVNHRLVDLRYNNLRPTLITSNLPAKQLRPALGERTTSRLREMCQVVTMPGEDRRRSPA